MAHDILFRGISNLAMSNMTGCVPRSALVEVRRFEHEQRSRHPHRGIHGQAQVCMMIIVRKDTNILPGVQGGATRTEAARLGGVTFRAR